MIAASTVANVEKKQKRPQSCPICKIGTVKRIAMGIYVCKKCNNKIAGKAYTLN